MNSILIYIIGGIIGILMIIFSRFVKNATINIMVGYAIGATWAIITYKIMQ